MEVALKIDKSQLYSNIKYKITEKNLKIGDVETRAGMTAGYLSKLQKDESKTNNILDFIVNVAKLLDVSIDSLIHVDYASLTNTEKYFADFIDKLIRDTIADELQWEKESFESFDDFHYQAQHPLFKVIEYEDGTYEPKKMGYNSFFTPGAQVLSDCFNVRIKEKRLYLMNVLISQSVSAKELYFVQWKSDFEYPKVIKICQIDTNSPLNELTEDLVMTARESSTHIKLEDAAKAIIDDFMSGIPF